MKNKLVAFLILMFPGMYMATAEEVPVPTPRSDRVPASPTENTNETAPELTPRVYQSACPALMAGKITGKLLPPVEDGQCGERSPLEVTAFGKIKTSNPVVMNCRMAIAGAEWLKDADTVSQNVLGSPIRSVVTSTSYQCRRRNNAANGKISEHGFANALDVSGFVLEDGRNVTVSADWKSEDENDGQDASNLRARFLRKVRSDACKLFTTVLSPEADDLHADHLHLDLGCHGKDCLYKICE